MRIDLTLSPGTVNQSVTVVAAGPLVQSTTSSLGTVVASAQIEALPLNGRLFVAISGHHPGSCAEGLRRLRWLPGRCRRGVSNHLHR